MKNQNVLILPDLQMPAQHPDALKFLKAIKKKFKINEVYGIGDTSDQQVWSNYDKSPDCPSVTVELMELQATVKEFAKVFPKVKVVLSNHDDRVLRKIRGAGIPKSLISDDEVLRRALECPKTWTFHDRFVLKTVRGDVLLIHGHQRGVTRAAGNTTNKTHMSTVFGHMHSLAHVVYRNTARGMCFEMCVGSLIDDNNQAFDYNNLDLSRPILTAGVIINGVPQLIPMFLNNKGRWDNKL